MPLATPPRSRDLTPDDLDALAPLTARLGRGAPPTDWRAYLRRPEAVAICAVDEGRIVGYAAGTVHSGFGMPGRVGWIEAFGVEVDRRGAGVGRALLGDILARFGQKGAAHVYTLVALHDHVLAPFFRQAGFRDEPLQCLGMAL